MLALSLVVPTLLLPHLSPPAPPLRARMQLFPTDDTGSVSVKITDSKGVTIRKPAPPTRGERLARLLSDMAEQPLEAEALLEAATPMLLAPFQPGTPQEEGSIFTDDSMSVREKIDVYARTLDGRISSARKAENKQALRLLRDHVLRSAEALCAEDGR